VCFDEASCGLVNEVGFSKGEEREGRGHENGWFYKVVVVVVWMRILVWIETWVFTKEFFWHSVNLT